LRDAVDTLSTVVDPLSNIADRIPLMPRRRRPRSPRAVSSERVASSERVVADAERLAPDDDL
jgi:hypothetical protein